MIQKNATILIADDNLTFRRTIVHFLKAQFDSVKVIQVANGREAIMKTDELIPDLVILDINMPEISGFEAALTIKKNYPFIPIIILTNYDENEYRLEAKKILVDAFILKENLISELPEVIHAFLMSHASHPFSSVSD
ncbi:MAG: response regulator transcription factor [Bacteroidota bacterium]|nr:response regulator transcription factor [Bacteroidota bacterium]